MNIYSPRQDVGRNSPNTNQKKSGGLTKPSRFVKTPPLFLQRPPDVDHSQEQTIQAKLRVGEVDDEYEHEADQVADQVMRQAKPTSTADDEDDLPELNTPLFLQRKPDSSAMNSTAVTSVSRSLSSPGTGQSLSGNVRSRVEPFLKHNLADVRVHEDDSANEAASTIGARAFTHQNHIYLGQGESQNDTQLMAHEATHVAQQKRLRKPMINRVTHRRESRPTTFTRTDVETQVDRSYWKEKVNARYALIPFNPVNSRFSADSEERDAVLSTLWQVKPAKTKTKAEKIVTIAARSGAKKSKDLIYRFKFIPGKGKKKASVEVQFSGEAGAAKVTAAPTPAATFQPSNLPMSYGGFPNKNNITAYFKANPEAHSQLFNWIENSAGSKLDQIITTSFSRTKGKKTSQYNASFKVEGSKLSSGDINKLEIGYLGAVLPQSASPGAGYQDKTYVDFELEKLQAKSKNKLGTITGMTGLPKDEISSVNYTIWQYFEFGKIRKSELDVIIPIAHTKRSVYYTLRFDNETNDVEVERIGEAGKGKVKPDEFDISRVQGFTDHSKDVATFSSWLKQRYPAATVTGKTVAELQTSINKEIKTKSTNAAWFEKNYDIYILDATTGDTRMDDAHKWSAGQRANIKDFQGDELGKLEFALQTMSLPVLARLKSVRMVRQDVLLKKRKRSVVAYPKTAGYTVKTGSDYTVLLLDSFTHSEQNLFTGGKQGVRSTGTEVIAHEFGHVVGYQSKIESKYNAFVKKNKIKSVSWYGATGKSEKFPEAFAFYHTDPEWMKNNQPELFKWFETLRTTGKPP
jgi:hypothetical protein